MKASHLEMNRPVGLISPFTTLLTVLAGALTLASPRAQANETVVWHRQALGQTNYCLNGTPWCWPNNNNWSQSQVMGNPCSEGIVVEQPSNWSTTNYPNGANYDVVLGSWGGAPTDLDLQVTLNSLTIQSDGGLTMRNGSRLTANTISFLGDGGVTLSGGGGLSPVMALANGGTMIKSSGAGAFVLDPGVVLNSYGGHFSVASGTLALPGNSSYYTNGDFAVASGATLTLVPDSQSVTFAGLFSGSGAGTALMNAGTLTAGPDGATLNLPGSLFRWTGGTMVSMANQGTITVSGSVYVAGGFYNYGLMHHTNTATLGIRGGSHFDNEVGGTYNLDGDGAVALGGGGGLNPYFQNFGLLRKSSGSGTSTISTYFYNQNGSIEVESGTLSLAGGGSSSNGTFIVASGAVLDLTGGGNPTWAGQVTGSGAGQVQLGGGTINTTPSLTFNLPGGLFQWTNGWLAGTTINSNAVTIAGSGSVYVAGGFYNYGLMHHTNTATLGIRSGSHVDNEVGGTYSFEGDGAVAPGGGGGTSPYFQNFGLLRKNGGSGTSTISTYFYNQNGSIEVESGTLSLPGGGSSSNGTFIVASGAVLDLTGGGNPTWAGQVNGSGAGQVQLGGGIINTAPSLTFNLPEGLFQWTNGWLAGTTINSNAVTIAGSGTVYVAGGFYNRGLVHHTSTATLGIRSGSHVDNEVGGTYSFEGDGAVAPGGGGGSTPYFQNSGLLRKSGGSGTSTISSPFSNQNGSIEVDSGTLSVGDYAQGTGTLAIKLGGRGAGQSGWLSVNGGASLSGPLNVSLANGFAPAPGDQFQILSSGGLSGTFTALNVPTGISVTYSNNGVFLVVTGTVPVQIVGPALSGGNLAFSFGTVTNQSYTIQRNDDLATTNWVDCTNFTGNGSLSQFVFPATNASKRFFRVREP